MIHSVGPQTDIVVTTRLWEFAVASLGLYTVGTKDNGIDDMIIHIRKFTLSCSFENPIVKNVNRLTIVLVHLGEFKSGHSEIAYWLTKLFEPSKYLVYIMLLVRQKVEIFIDIFTIWSCPNQQHACFNLA